MNNYSRKDSRASGLVSMQSYSSLGAVMAGVAITAIVLILTLSSSSDENVMLYVSWSVIALLLSFWCSIIASAFFSLFCGFDQSISRSHVQRFYGGSILITSVLLVMWAVVLLTNMFFADATGWLQLISHLILISMALGAPSFILSEEYPVYYPYSGLIKKGNIVRTSRQKRLLAIPYIPLSAAFVYQFYLLCSEEPFILVHKLVPILFILLMFFTMYSIYRVMSCIRKNADYTISFGYGVAYVTIHTLLFSALIISLPLRM
jgi:uncharacterized membrane protein YidH (DUF202 family)